MFHLRVAISKRERFPMISICPQYTPALNNIYYTSTVIENCLENTPRPLITSISIYPPQCGTPALNNSYREGVLCLASPPPLP